MWTGTNTEMGFPVIDTSDIASGYCIVPVTVDDNGTEYKCQMLAG
jgi:hypothetical protein